jgi:hypothetical protein
VVADVRAARYRVSEVAMSGLSVVLGVAIAGLVILAVWRHAKRRKELTAWAAAHGLSFSPERDRGFDERYRAFSCLRRGHSRYAYNIAHGSWNGREVRTFDYHYATGSGKDRHDYHFSGVVLGSDVPLKPLHIRPEGLFDKVTEFFGVDDIDFESAEFSRAFYVKAPDKRWAYDVLHQRSMEFLLRMPRFSIQFDTRCVMVWKRRRFSPEQFEEAIAVAAGLLDGLPPYLVQQQEGRMNS